MRLGGLFNQGRKDREVQDELESHIQMHTEDNLRCGLPPEEARRQAMIKLGGIESTKEAYRDQRGLPVLETLWQDVRFGGRMLRKSPGFTVTVVLTLALGIGAGTAIFSVVNTVILNPVPGPEPERLIQIGERSHGNKDEPRFGGVDARSLEILRTKQDYYSDVIWWESLYLEQKSEDFIEGLAGTSVSTNFFSPWNIRPMLGRTFGADEAARLVDFGKLDRDAVMVLSHSLWQSRFGGDRNVLGKVIEGNGRHFTIIGVMPPQFQFPGGAGPTFWVPVANPREQVANVKVFVRLKPGVTVERTQAMLNVVAGQLLREFPRDYDDPWHKRGGGFGFLIRPLRHEFTQAPFYAADLQHTLWGLLAAIGFVLLIVCLIVAILMLALIVIRQLELVIRAAVGAGRFRLLGLILSVRILLASLGALGGMVVTYGGMKLLVLLIPETIPRLKAIQVNGQALGVSLVLSLGTALVFGLVPAWQASRASAGKALKQAGTGATISIAWRRYRGGLIVAEVALSLVLLAGAGLMIQSVIHLLRANPGFDPEKLLLVHPGLLRGEKYYGSADHSTEVHVALFDELQHQFAGLAGVMAVGIGKIEFFKLGYALEGEKQPIGLLRAGTGVGDSDLFRAMRIPLLAGRLFDKSDIGNKVGTVIVNETMARLCWPGENPLNKRFREKDGSVYEVVGLVGDARIGLRSRYVDPVEPTFYRPYQGYAASGGFGPFFIVRAQNDPRSLIPAIREAMKSVESSMTTPWFQVARQTLYDATQAQRTYMLYLVLFAGVGLLLSALGIYGVLSYSVARRTREIGVRMALGAGQRDVLGMVIMGGARMVGAGIFIGLLASFGLTRFLRHQLYEISPTDPVVFLGVVLLLFVVALVACYLPARRAAKVDPMVALRYE